MSKVGGLNMKVLLAIFAVLLAADATRCRAAVVAYEALLDKPEKVLSSLFVGALDYQLTILRRATTPSVLQMGGEYERLMAFHTRAPLDPDFDKAETAYGFYLIPGTGVVTGVNQKWRRGVIQVFVAFDIKGAIHDIYVQRLDGGSYAPFRTAAYRKPFRRFSIDYAPDEAFLRPPAQWIVPATDFSSQALVQELPERLTIEAHQAVLRAVRLIMFVYRTLYRNDLVSIKRVDGGP